MNILKKTRNRILWLSDLLNRSKVEQNYRRAPPPVSYGAKEIVMVEGLWDNPNHWLRLWVFLHGILKHRQADVVGILRSRKNWDNWNKRRSLEALGVRSFLYLEDARPAVEFESEAAELLKGVTTARQILDLKLPESLPAYTLFDTVLKLERHPQPPVEGNPVWQRALIELLQLSDLYRRFFSEHDVVAVVSSHAWKNEWAALCWTALYRKIPFYYMTAHYNSIRIRRMASTEEYRTPNENLGVEEFQNLPQGVRTALIERGRHYLAERFSGESDFIIIRYAMRPELRKQGRAALLESMRLDPTKPLVVIYAHSWFDFPHTQAMSNFTEPLDWLQFTLETVRPLTSVNWAFKAHPCDRWYGGIRLLDLVKGLPPHIALVPDDSDSLAVQSAAEALITIQGTIAVEAAAMGKTALCADECMYTPWGFAHTAVSREDYAAKLQEILNLERPTAEQSERAFAYAATAQAPPPKQADALELSCDTLFLERALYHKVHTLLANDETLSAEIEKIAQWIVEEHPSYNVWRIIDWFKGNQ